MKKNATKLSTIFRLDQTDLLSVVFSINVKGDTIQ